MTSKHSLMAFAALCCTALSSATALAVERIAIVIGANQAPSGRKTLRYAHKDADGVAGVLTNLGEFKKQDVHVLYDPEPSEVLAHLDTAVRRLASHPESMLFFYYSGHADENALYPSGRRLALDDLTLRLDDSAVTVRLGVIDSCRGGGWTGTKGLNPVETFDLGGAMTMQNEGSVLIASSSGQEDAHESEALQGSYFTHHFTAGLSGAADENRDERVSVVEAFQYARAFTIRDTALVAVTPQHPSFKMNLRGGQDLPLSNLRRGTSFLALQQDEGPLEVVQLESGLVILELKSGRREARVSVPPGRYLVRRRQAGKVYAKEYVVEAGKSTRVAELHLELTGAEEMKVVGGDLKKLESEFFLVGAAGVRHDLSYAFSETLFGRIAPGELPSGYAAWATRQSRGLEFSLPGRLGWRFGQESSVELVPWLGLPYYFTSGEDELSFSVALGAGVDIWWKLGGGHRLGANLGVHQFPEHDSGAGPTDFTRAFGALGYSLPLGSLLRMNVGVGYAQNLAYASSALGDLVDSEAMRQVAFGSVMTDGVLPLPLLEYRASDDLSLGVFAQGRASLPDGPFGFEAMFGLTWHFGTQKVYVEKD